MDRGAWWATVHRVTKSWTLLKQKTQQWPQDWKRSVFIPISKKCNAKVCSYYFMIALISHASKVMLKILQARLQKYAFKMDLEKAEDKRSNCQHPLDHRKSKGTPEKTFTFTSLTTLMHLTVWITANCGKFFKRREYQTTLPAS